MSQDELSVMDGSKCILQLRGVRPFFSRKYDITVVTSDGLEQVIIRGAGCGLISSREFEEEVKRRKDSFRKEYEEKAKKETDKIYLGDFLSKK